MSTAPGNRRHRHSMGVRPSHTARPVAGCFLLAMLFMCSAAGCAQEGNVATEKAPAANAAATGGAPGEGQDLPETSPLDQAAAGHSAEVPAETLPFKRIAPWLGDLDGMADRRVIRILTVYSVGRYYLDGAKESGLVKEAAIALEDFINQRVGNPASRIHVVVIPMARDRLIPALLQGKGDIVAAGLSITDEREARVQFSIAASKPLSEILVTGPAASPLASVNDLSGRTVYLRRSSSYRESVETLNASLRNQGKAPISIEYVSEALEDDDLVEMVNAGMLPWAIVDDYKLPWWEDVFTALTVREDIVFNSGRQVAWAMRPDNPQLTRAVNDFLQGHREGTLFGNILRNRYFRDFDWAGNATAPDVMSRYSDYRDFFYRYGDKYQFDPLLLAAQGYQESRLDQSARSSMGAVGVMQIKPSTARDKNVGIDDVHTAEPNIHAGTKYLAFLRERYFSDEEIDARNQMLMALAAYNMGPARMIQVRSKAAEMGYDPNRWFDHVEVAAARHVGREPVTYVANISKYYLAYTLNEQQIAQREAARERAGIEP